MKVLEKQPLLLLHVKEHILSIKLINLVAAPGQSWTQGQFTNGSFFSIKAYVDFQHCYSWGDPHTYNYRGVSQATEKSLGTFLFATCSDAFEVRIFTLYTQWWSNTVIRTASVRAFDRKCFCIFIC